MIELPENVIFVAVLSSHEGSKSLSEYLSVIDDVDVAVVEVEFEFVRALLQPDAISDVAIRARANLFFIL